MTAAHDLAQSRNMLTLDDVDLIMESVFDLPADAVVVDLGAGSGTTAAAILLGHPTARVVTVDVDENNLEWARRVVSNLGMLDRWTPVLADSAAYAGQHEGAADLVLVDTAHTYEHTVAEIGAWHGRLPHGTPIWFHDYTGDYPGVAQAISEAIDRGELAMVRTQGLGCLFLTVKVPPDA